MQRGVNSQTWPKLVAKIRILHGQQGSAFENPVVIYSTSVKSGVGAIGSRSPPGDKWKNRKSRGGPVRGGTKNPAGIGVSSGTGSSPSSPLESDSPTLVDFPQVVSDSTNPEDPEATFVDVDATMADVIPRLKQPPAVRRQSPQRQVSTPLLEPGDVLGNHQIVQLLGEGGMGAVPGPGS